MDIKKLEKLIYKNARLFNMTLASKKVNPFIIREDYHLSTVVENDLFSWELQMTIGITTNGLIHMMMFMHPVIVEDNPASSFDCITVKKVKAKHIIKSTTINIVFNIST